MSSLYAKSIGREFCAAGERLFHEFRGYFIEEKAWRSSTENPAKVEIIEPGPLRVTLQISGKIASVPFRSNISFAQGQRRIDFHTQFQFEKDTWIGDPWENQTRRTNDRSEAVRIRRPIQAAGALSNHLGLGSNL